MVVEKGFKTSDVGIIPIEWDTQKLVDLTKLFTKQTGFDYSAYIKPALVQTKSDETIPFIQNKDFNNKWINFKTDYFIPLSVAKQFPKILLDEKSLLISISGSIGNIGVYESEHLAFIGGAVAILKFKDPRIIDWVMFFLKSSEGQKKLFGNVKAGSHQNLILDDIRKVKVPLPPLPEQTAIATALSDMDGLITQTEKLIEKKKAIKQGVMQKLLRPKDGWVTKKLGDYGRTYGGITGKTKIDFGKGNSKYIPFMNIMSNPIIDLDYMDSVEIKPNEIQNKVLKGDLFFNGSSETPEEVGLCSVLDKDVENVYLNSFCFGYRMHNTNELNGLFISYLFRSPLGRSLIFSLAQGATRYNLSKTNLLKLELPIPNKVEQDNIALTLMDIDKLIQKYEIKLQKLKLQKQGMMQALLTGKIRLV